MDRSEPELLLDAQSLIKHAGRSGIGQPGMMEEVRDILVELHRNGSTVCLEAARRVCRRFAVVFGGTS